MSTVEKILELLKKSGDKEISGGTICDELGISRNAVWKHVKALRAQGYLIEAHSRCGYKLLESPDRPDRAEVDSLLETERIGRELIYRDSTDSTNSDATVGAEAGCADGTVYCAGAQRGGRGRMKRSWYSPDDVNLYFSMVLRPDVPISRAPSLPLVAGIAVASVINRLAPDINPRVKWPNDILINGKKVCGILCEMQAEIDCRVRYIVAGIGVNVNLSHSSLPEELQKIATSLKIESGREFSRVELLASLLNEFELVYDIWLNDGFLPMVELMDRFDALKGRMIAVEQGNEIISGCASGIQDDGALLIETVKGIVPVYSGETKVTEW